MPSFFNKNRDVMYKILKFTLPMKEKSCVDMPYGARLIRAENQDGFVCVWAICDINAPKTTREFRLYKTGQDIDEIPELLIPIGRADIHVGMDLGMWVFELVKS